MTKAHRFHASDTDEEVYARHAEVEKRLEEIGRSGVHAGLLSGAFPTQWNTIIHAWLAGDKLEDKDAKP
jgi:hypothetical protein